MTDRKEIPAWHNISRPTSMRARETPRLGTTTTASETQGARCSAPNAGIECGEDEKGISVFRRRLLCHLYRVLWRDEHAEGGVSILGNRERFHRLGLGGATEHGGEGATLRRIHHDDPAPLGGSSSASAPTPSAAASGSPMVTTPSADPGAVSSCTRSRRSIMRD